MAQTPATGCGKEAGRGGALARRWTALPGNVRGAVWITLSALSFTLMAAVIKLLGAALSSFEIAFFRSLFGLAFTLPFCLKAGPAAFATRRLPMHLGRAACGVTAMFGGYYGITHLPLADATAIGFTKTLFMIVLAVLFLGERVRRRRWMATAAGFAGAVLMLRPGGEGPVFAVLAALAGAAAVSGSVVFVKKLTASERPATILFYYGVISTLVAALPAAAVWRTPSMGELALLATVAGFAVAGQFLAIRGYGAGEATAVMPFGYARLIFAGLIGFLFFAELPDAWSLAGAAVIVASTLYIGLREAAKGRRGPLGDPDSQP